MIDLLFKWANPHIPRLFRLEVTGAIVRQI